NVLLITVDTIRADRLGAYGFEGIDTPIIDSLAARGVTFTRAYSPTPLTLPSHASIFSGTFPPYHGVRDNGAFAVPAELTLMAEVFQANGFATAAFVGAFVLDSRFGLDQGFESYFDDFELPRQNIIGLGTVQRPAEEVIDAALEWLEGEGGLPFFLWVHLYDPHTPYAPPEPYRSEYAGKPYLGEIAYTDAQIGRLLEGLSGRGVAADTFVVVVGDHGESLGEHGEIEHGFFVYEESIHVPLIISLPFAQLHGVRRSQLVSLVDIMPTVLEMSGLDLPPALQGLSLVPLFSGQPDDWRQYVYSETFYPRYHFGWSELQAVQDERYKLILSPEPELYDLLDDPDESNNLAAERVSVFATLEREAEAMIAAYGEGGGRAQVVEIDEDTRQSLAALGYLGGFQPAVDDDQEVLPSPRDRIGVYNDLLMARRLKHQGRLEESQLLLEQIVVEAPAAIDAYMTLGNLHSEQGRHIEAIAVFEAAIAEKPTDTSLLLLLASENMKLRRFDQAEKLLMDFIDVVPEDARIYYFLGNLNRFGRNHRTAIEYYRKSIALNPQSAASHTGLASSYLSTDEVALAEEHINRALEIDDSIPDVNFTLAQVYQKRGALDDARRGYLRELELFPSHLRASYNLSIVYREEGLVGKEEEYLRKAIEINPDFPLSHLFLARIYMHRGEQLEEAAHMVEWAMQQQLPDPDLAFGHFLLADLYNRLGDAERARENARMGEQVRRRIGR
ncbi:MAG: sulfatase-like hydrolase/transferase, partial [Acidobacteria bacterium]|nr:sulfatase-like hydrolase/transferase [Acidobacteriota bacterium]